ncbi:hypothetical protein GGS24DRAFT_499055 [Hypoxylon argillaceum]|nr:hypothetical protein GGS24DRAFT_499055 [Hypoxylon argillaceum]
MASFAPSTGGQSITTRVDYIIATPFQGIAVLAQPSYVPLPWHTVLIIRATSLFSVLMN